MVSLIPKSEYLYWQLLEKLVQMVPNMPKSNNFCTVKKCEYKWVQCRWVYTLLLLLLLQNFEFSSIKNLFYGTTIFRKIEVPWWNYLFYLFFTCFTCPEANFVCLWVRTNHQAPHATTWFPAPWHLMAPKGTSAPHGSRLLLETRLYTLLMVWFGLILFGLVWFGLVFHSLVH